VRLTTLPDGGVTEIAEPASRPVATTVGACVGVDVVEVLVLVTETDTVQLLIEGDANGLALPVSWAAVYFSKTADPDAVVVVPPVKPSTAI
jgi:hypothetical protein